MMIHFLVVAVKTVFVVPTAALKHNVALGLQISENFHDVGRALCNVLEGTERLLTHKLHIELDAELLPDVEDIGGHHVDIQHLDVGGSGEGVHVLDVVIHNIPSDTF